ncbi:hypothetical protein PLICRDRAFT_35380 [Plicaturopsis crispa FD-325 SS-3]|nr:hypothetical protein PLICRDRAFT_35380 [Plicaturopsis crispa FD-325 SS-3]
MGKGQGHKRTSESARLATNRWMNKAGVREKQNEKARLRVAKNRARNKAAASVGMSDLQSAGTSKSTSGRVASSSAIIPPVSLRQYRRSASLDDINGSQSSDGQSDEGRNPFDEGSDGLVTLEEPDDIAHNLRRCRLEMMNWQCNWGSDVTYWEKHFSELLEEARQLGDSEISDGVVNFFQEFEAHVQEGKDILEDLKHVAVCTCDSTPDEIRDLFFQGFEMVMAVCSEVKFFETKLSQYAPAIPLSKVTDYRSYGNSST